MAGMEGHWALRGFGPYAIVEKESGALVGAAGLWHPGNFPRPRSSGCCCGNSGGAA